MSTSDPFSSADHHSTRRGIVLGAASCAAIYAISLALVPALSGMDEFGPRLQLALWLCAGPGLFVYATFFACLRYRDTPEAVNPLLGGESLAWRINQRVLTNTVEQIVMFLPLLLALAARVDGAHAYLLPLHVGMWLAARIAFWIGYRVSPAWRAPGMSATHVITILTIAWLVRYSVA